MFSTPSSYISRDIIGETPCRLFRHEVRPAVAHLYSMCEGDARCKSRIIPSSPANGFPRPHLKNMLSGMALLAVRQPHRPMANPERQPPLSMDGTRIRS